MESPRRPRIGSQPGSSGVAQARVGRSRSSVYLACTAVYFACAPRQLWTEHTKFNHYALLADAWLHHRLDLGHPPPAYTQNNDFAEFSRANTS